MRLKKQYYPLFPLVSNRQTFCFICSHQPTVVSIPASTRRVTLEGKKSRRQTPSFQQGCPVGGCGRPGGQPGMPYRSSGWTCSATISAGHSCTSSGAMSFYVIFTRKPTCIGQKDIRLPVFEAMLVIARHSCSTVLSLKYSFWCIKSTACA